MLSENLKASRIKCNLTQEQAAEELHIVRQTISRWEKGLSLPDAEQLLAISKLYGVSMNELLDEPAEKKIDREKIYEKLTEMTEQIKIKNQRSRQFWLAITVFGILIILYGAAQIAWGIYNYNATLTLNYLKGKELNNVLSSFIEIYTRGCKKAVVGIVLVVLSRIAAHRKKLTSRERSA